MAPIDDGSSPKQRWKEAVIWQERCGVVRGMQRRTLVARKCVAFVCVAVLVVALTSCEHQTASTTGHTDTTVASNDAEKAFMIELTPDVVSWGLILNNHQMNRATDQEVYAEMQRLLDHWGDRDAPSARTEAFFKAWLEDVRVCDKYWGLLLKNDASGAEAMSEAVGMAIQGANLPESLAQINHDLGVPSIPPQNSTAP